MKKLMLYLTEEEYEFIRQEAFRDGEKMSGYVKGCVFVHKGEIKPVSVHKDNTGKTKKENSVNTGDSKPPSLGSIPSSFAIPVKQGVPLCEHGLPKSLCKHCQFK